MGPIRILHVVTYKGRGGLETMIMNYYRHMDRNRVQFDFLVHREFRADYDDEIETLGGRIYRLPKLVPWSKDYRTKLDGFWSMHPEYRIVHVHQDCLSSVILKSAKDHNVPVRIAHSHNSRQDRNLKYLIKLYYRRLIPAYATKLFACGKEAGDWMFRGATFQILNNAIDTNQYVFNVAQRVRMRKQLGIPDSTFVVGHVGRFAPQKNHAFLLDLFAELRKHISDSVLLLVGDGDLRSMAEEKATALGIVESVIFMGVRSDIPDLMQAMDCFLFPSQYEGVPVTLVEAQAAGLPCIVSDRVPAECAKTSLVQRIALNTPKAVWTEHIVATVGKLHMNTYSEIVASGYDIMANAQWLQNYYLEQWEKG